jgi:hypothetical protein
MAAVPFKETGRIRHVDADGNILPGIPVSLRMSCSDVAGAKVTFDDYDNDKFFIIPPGPPGAIGAQFVDMKGSADGGDTKSLQLVIGNATSTLVLKDDQLAEKAVDAHTRMQGLDSIVFGIGQRIGFTQLA